MAADSSHLTDRITSWLAEMDWRQQTLAWLRARHISAYLVGGTVRDALLGIEGRDLDMAIDGDALAAGRGLADHLDGAYVPLDIERNVARVVIRTRQGFGREHIDLAGLRGPGIVADLRARDLTINAMAVQVSPNWGDLLDPTGGVADLGEGLMRVASETAFVDDPLRMLRVARMRGKLGLSVAPDTLLLVAKHATGLDRVSPERVRDELFLMLDQDDASDALSFAQEHHLWDHCLPLHVSSRGLADLETLEHWLTLLDRADRGASSDLPMTLSRFRQGLLAHWAQEMPGGRQRRSLVKLATLGISSQERRATLLRLGRYLCLSTTEARAMSRAVAATPQSQGDLTPLDIYRFYRELGDGGVDAAVLAMVASPAKASIQAHADQLLDAWFSGRKVLVDPPRLVTGRDVLTQARLEPGPAVGQLLEALREAQVLGEIQDRQGALAWLAAQRK